MELVQYIKIVQKWFWLLVLAGLVGGTVRFVDVFTTPDQYRAESLIAIGGFINAPNPGSGDIATSIDLTETYAQLVRTQDVLQSTIDALGVSLSTGRLNSMLVTDIIPKTSFLRLTVTSTDPILAADLVNELVKQVILASPTNLDEDTQQQMDRIRDQIDALSSEVTSLREQLAALDLQLTDPNLRSTERVDILSQRTIIVNQINSTTENVVSFTNIINDLRQRTNSVDIIDKAQIPESPVGKGVSSAVMMGMLVSTSFVFALVLLYEYLNSTQFRSTEELSQVLRQPILGHISRYGKKNDMYVDKLLINNMDTRVPDEYRILRTNLLFASDLSTGIYIVTSAAPDEGKTTVISNLAISLAMSGLRVLLIDADLRKPQVHRMFDLENTIGLTTLLTSSLSPEVKMTMNDNNRKAEDDSPMAMWQDSIRAIPDIDNLWVLSSGTTVLNPTELLGSTIMKNWIDTIQSEMSFDIVLIDTPPLLGFPDSAVMAVSLDAKVIPVIKANGTRHEPAMRMIERLIQVQAQIVGIILNQANPRQEAYQSYSYYKSYYNS